MKEKPSLIIYEELEFIVGEETFVESVAENNNAVLFEDDCETGYFYAIDINNNLTILDALHIYDVANIIDKQKTSEIKILWTLDLSKAFLSINNYYHAVFDFEAKGGYCRNGFPESKSVWTLITERKLTETLIDQLAKT
jgi:hypothetical protein